MLLHLCTWAEVEQRLKASTGIIIPIGSTEQHGPNGLVGTDAICGEVFGRAVGEATDALVAPTIAVGMAQHHLGFAGSMTLRPSTFIAVVRDMVQSLARHGFERFYFVNGHGGNIAPLSTAFSEIYAEMSLRPAGNAAVLRCRQKAWWQTEAAKKITTELYGDSEGSHATPSEVSVTQYVYPEAIKRAAMNPEIAPKGEFADAADFRRRFPDGRMGSNPALATPEAGKRIIDAVVPEIADEYRRFLAEA
jgi:creatinine amidohydrolase